MTRLVVLGMLLDGPKHGYAIQRVLKDGRYDLWANILPNSIYNALRKMTRDGMVRVHGTETRGRQTRTVYEITEKGRKDFAELLKTALSRYVRRFPSDLYVALGYLHRLPTDEIIDALDAHRSSLEDEMRLWDDGLKRKTSDSPAAESLTALFENGKAHIRADMDFVEYARSNVEGVKAILEQDGG